jgi:hypothetical protein
MLHKAVVEHDVGLGFGIGRPILECEEFLSALADAMAGLQAD